MQPYHHYSLCIAISVIIVIHTTLGLGMLMHYVDKEISNMLDRDSVVEDRIHYRVIVKRLLDVFEPIVIISFWALALFIYLRPKDLTKKQYRIYYIVTTAIWQLLVLPLMVMTLLHSVYMLIILLDDVGFLYGETANNLHAAFSGLSAFVPEENKIDLINWLVSTQRRYSCCGGTSYMNWLTLDMKLSNEDPFDPMSHFDPWGQRFVSGFFPTSCCDRSKNVQCVTSILTPSAELTTYYMRYETPVYHEDCTDALYSHVYLETAGLIGVFSAVDITLHLLQVGIQLYAYYKTAPQFPCAVWFQRLPPLQSLLTPPRFGSRRESTGSEVHRTGSITHVDGSRTHRDGSVTFPDGSTLPRPERLVHRSGSVTLRSGSRVHRTGSQTHVDGSRTHRTGSISYPDGTRIHRDHTYTPGPGDSRQACMVGNRAQLFFESTGYISTERLIQACQGIPLLAQPSLLQKLDLENKADWLEKQMKIGWMARGDGKYACVIMPRINLKRNKAAGPTQTSEMRRFLRLHLPLLEAVIYADGNVFADTEANLYYRSFVVAFTRGLLFLIFGFIVASLLFTFFVPTNLDSPVLNTAYSWHADPVQRDREDIMVAEHVSAIHVQVVEQSKVLLYAAVMYGSLVSRRVRCMLLLLIPIFAMFSGHAYFANEMLHATLLGPVANIERNFIMTTATLECLAELSYNLSRDIRKVTNFYPLEDEIAWQYADLLGDNDIEQRKNMSGIMTMSQELRDTVVEQLTNLSEHGTQLVESITRYTNMTPMVEANFTGEVAKRYLEVAKDIIATLVKLNKNHSTLLQKLLLAEALPGNAIKSFQNSITEGGQLESKLSELTVLQCMLIQSVNLEQCQSNIIDVCAAITPTIGNLTYEPFWFQQLCGKEYWDFNFCSDEQYLSDARITCFDMRYNLRTASGYGSQLLHANNLIAQIIREFEFTQANESELDHVFIDPVPLWMKETKQPYDEMTVLIRDIMYSLFYSLIIITALLKLFLVGVIYQANTYVTNYLTDKHYDNVYAGHMFESIDIKRATEGRENLLPLKSMELSNVYWHTKFYTAKELKTLSIGILRTVVFGVILLLLFAVYTYLYEIVLFFVDLTAGYYGMHVRFQQIRHGGSHAVVDGDGVIQRILMRFLQIVKRLKDVDLQYDPAYCSPYAYKVSDPLHYDFFRSWGLLVLLVLLAPLLLRSRHVITSFFYPARTRARTVELYNSMLVQRRRHMTTCRNQIIHWVREGRLQEEARRLSQPTFLASISVTIAKWLRMDKKVCIICRDVLNSGPSVNVCTLDRTALCRSCAEKVLKKDICVVCLDRNPKRLFKERRRLQRLDNTTSAKK